MEGREINRNRTVALTLLGAEKLVTKPHVTTRGDTKPSSPTKAPTKPSNSQKTSLELPSLPLQIHLTRNGLKIPPGVN